MKHLYIVAVCIVSVIILGAFSSTRYSGEFKNLKILPKDISSEKLDSIMQSYNKALDVSCGFCHISKDGVEDFASDAKPEKEVARKMMRLTIDINQKYFNFDSTLHPAYLNVVTCNTCHKGNAYPHQ